MLEIITPHMRNEFVSVIERHLPEIHYYSPNFLDRRIAFVMKKMGFSDWNEFVQNSKLDNQFVDKFLMYFSVPTTEMFRDFDMWKCLYSEILPKIIETHPKVWIPDSASGQELFSLCILLSEMNALNKVTIYAGNKSKLAIEEIQKGRFLLQDEMSFFNNYQAIGTPGDLKQYYKKTQNSLVFNPDLLQNVQFIHAHSVLSQRPQTVNLILYRNSLLYFTEDLKHRFISHIYNHLEFGGYVVLGMKEGTSIFGIDTLFKLEKKVERIYRKK